MDEQIELDFQMESMMGSPRLLVHSREQVLDIAKESVRQMEKKKETLLGFWKALKKVVRTMSGHSKGRSRVLQIV